MSVKNLPILVAAILLGTTTLASAQALVFSPYTYTYTYTYGYFAYPPTYAPAVTYGLANSAILRTRLLCLCAGLQRLAQVGLVIRLSQRQQPRKLSRLLSYLKSSLFQIVVRELVRMQRIGPLDRGGSLRNLPAVHRCVAHASRNGDPSRMLLGSCSREKLWRLKQCQQKFFLPSS